MSFSAENKTPLEMLYHWEETASNDVFLRQPVQLEWTEITWSQFADRVRRLANWLSQKNYEPGSRIAMFSKNCADWLVVDFAIQMAGHVSVPLYPGQDAESARYVMEHSESKLIFLGEFDQVAKVDDIVPEGVDRVAMQFCSASTDTSLEAIIASAEPMTESPVQPADELMTILYTSGTSGNPKGVMHVHGMPGSVLPRMQNALGLGKGGDRERFMSFLPMSHAAERCIVEMNAVYCNGIISFSEGLETFAQELGSVQPSFFFAVPRLWLKFKAAVDAKIPPAAQAKFGDEERAAVRKQLGLSQARMVLTGSAPCPSDVQNWFLDMGVFLREGYSMTENFCDGAFWLSDERPTSGCVGKPLPGVEMKITDEDEVCFKSDGLMKGYYKNPEKTDEVLIDGWYHTGDTGKVDEDGNLWITGRISEVFKTTKGKFIQPKRIEEMLSRLDEIQQVCVCGHGLDQPIALVALSELAAKEPADQLKATLEEYIDGMNSGLPGHERVARLVVCSDEWTIENGLLTPTMKIKRRGLIEKYKVEIAAPQGDETVVFC